MKIVKGDILSGIKQGDRVAILHGCNCFHTMGSGIAKYLVDKYPSILEVDKKTKYGNKIKLGGFSKAEQDDGVVIYNCYTQFNYGKGKHVEYTAVCDALYDVKMDITYNYGLDIDIRAPKIGCGLGGGSWKLVKLIFEAVFPQVTIYCK